MLPEYTVPEPPFETVAAGIDAAWLLASTYCLLAMPSGCVGSATTIPPGCAMVTMPPAVIDNACPVTAVGDTGTPNTSATNCAMARMTAGPRLMSSVLAGAFGLSMSGNIYWLALAC